jgi:hypothetical protein
MTGERVPAKLRSLYEEIVSIGREAALKHLDSEFAELVAPLTAALARKRPSPLTRGRPATWAAGVLSVIARTNFLFDRTQVPHCTPDELTKACGVSYSAAAGKARTIEDLPPSRLRDNPLVWFIEVDGVVVDARTLPKELQEKAVEAGAIPFLP